MICKYILLIMFLNEPKLILLLSAKSFPVLLRIINNPIKNQWLLYIRLNDQTAQLQTIQFSISHLFVHCLNCPVGWDCRIHRLLLCRTVWHLTNERAGYDTKQSDGKVPVTLDLCGMQSISLTLLPGPPPVTPDRVLSMAQIELNCVLMQNWIVWNGTVFDILKCTYAKLNCLK